jgi:hypothetical protein
MASNRRHFLFQQEKEKATAIYQLSYWRRRHNDVLDRDICIVSIKTRLGLEQVPIW